MTVSLGLTLKGLRFTARKMWLDLLACSAGVSTGIICWHGVLA